MYASRISMQRIYIVFERSTNSKQKSLISCSCVYSRLHFFKWWLFVAQSNM